MPAGTRPASSGRATDVRIARATGESAVDVTRPPQNGDLSAFALPQGRGDGTLFGALGFEENGLGEDPLMTDPANGDFTLQAGSPCRNVGTDVSLTRDYKGVSVPQETSPAIGAYAFVMDAIGGIFSVPAESRSYAIVAESRSHAVVAEARTLTI